jgi:tryptophanyl-tRNA synthetase
VVDYHSITMPYDPKKLRANTWNMIFQVLACGVNMDRLFIQSLIPEHTELCWILGSMTSYGDLTRMTQFKDKTDQVKEKGKEALISGGLFYYPVLQAADILIYHADYVPVGKDQEQHLELSRGIASRFNTQFNTEYFTLPESLFTAVPKVLSLADPTKKMSKSLGEKHFVNMFGDLDKIRKQVKSAVTDSGESEGMSAGVQNLFTLLQVSGRKEAHDSLMTDYNNDALRYSDLKQEVTDGLINMITPIQERYKVLQSDKKNIKEQIKASSHEIRKEAAKTLREVKEIAGLLNPRA